MKTKENTDLLKFGFKLKKFCEEFKNKKYRVILNNGEVFYSRYLFFYFYLLNKEFNNISFNTIIKNNFEKAEKQYPGCSFYLAENLCNHIIGNSINENKTEKVNLTKNNIEKYFLQIIDKSFFEKVFSTIEFIGPDGSIFCKESKNDYISCERKDICTFNFKINNEIRDSLFSSKDKKSGSFLISICDVFFERESDVLPLIEKAKETKRNVILICRGATKNFIVNLKRLMVSYNLLVYLYTDTFDNEDPFKFSDISSATNSSIVSKEKGNVIVRDILESYGLIEEAIVYEDKIEFIPANVECLDKITRQISESNSEELKKYFLFRKQRLSSKVANVYIPDSNKKLLQNYKDVINSYNKILKFGLVKDKNSVLHSAICYENAKVMSQKLYEILCNTNLVLKGRFYA